MLSFEFSPEQLAFRDVLAEFSRRVLAPGYIRRAAAAEFPWDVQRGLGELGVLGIGLPAEFGGTGEEDPVLLGLAAETLAFGDVNMAAAPVQTGLIGAQLAMAASRAVQEEYIPPMIRGEAVVAIALSEPDSGSDASGLRTEAVPVPGGWRLRGEKSMITQATVARAALVYARAPGSGRSKGVSCFLVPMDSRGVRTSHMPGMGCLPLCWGTISLDDVFVPADHLLGVEGRGFSAALHHFDFSRAALGLMCLGAAQASLDEAAAYARERETFGRKIASYQGVSFPLAEQATYVEGARWLSYRALWLRQTGQKHSAQAAMSKWWGPNVALGAIETAMRVHGGIGYSVELPLQQRFRDVMSYYAADGSAEIQKRLIATEILGRVAADR